MEKGRNQNEERLAPLRLPPPIMLTTAAETKRPTLMRKRRKKPAQMSLRDAMQRKEE